MTTPLFPHQAEAINIAKTQSGLALFHDPGLGKTRTVLEIFKNYKLRVSDLKLLVICPLSIIEDAWEKNWKLYASEFSFCSMRKDKKPWTKDIMVINYESFITKKTYELIIKMANHYNIIIALDESSRLKNYKSKTTKVLLRIRHLFLAHLIMSGTPAPNGEWEYWGQIAFVNPSVLPRSFLEFRNRYFYLGRGKQIASVGWQPGRMMQEGWKICINEEDKQRLFRQIKDVVHRADKATALPDLPPKVEQERIIYLSKEERDKYNEMKKHLIVEIAGETIAAPAVLTKIMKLRQQTSGFIFDQQRKAHWYGKSKLRELMAVLEELGSQQVIIWCEFQPEIDKLAELYSGKCALMYQKVKAKDRTTQRISFQSGEKQYLLAHPKSAAHGLEFPNCSAMVYFNNSFSLENKIQTADRNHRPGQDAEFCLYIYLVVDNTVDTELIYPALRNKGQVSNEMLNKFLRRQP
jgi:SNF2 family DNA or RNA helicase